MKKFIVLLFSTLLLLLSACSQESQFNGLPNKNKKTDQNSSSDSPQSSGLNMLCDDSSTNHFGTKNGYYYLTGNDKIAAGLTGEHLMYIDYSTKKEVYLCSDSGCRHDTENCSSVFSTDEFGTDNLVFVHQGFLYILSRDPDQDGISAVDMMGGGSDGNTESKFVVLYQMGLDGSSRKKIFTFPVNTTIEKLVFSDGEDLWFVTKKLEFERDGNTSYTTSTNRALSKLSLSNGKIINTIPLEFGDNMRHEVIAGSGTQFVLSSIEYPQGMSEKDVKKLSDDEWKKIYKKSNTVCSTLDINSKQKKEIYHQPNNQLSLNCTVKDGYMFISDYENGGIFKIDLNSGDKSALSTIAQNYIYYVLNDSICCRNNKTENDNTLYFVDIKTGETKHSTLTNKRLGWTLNILADAGNKVLVIYDYEATPHSDGSYEITHYQYGLISKSDLYDSKDNYEPIAMAGRGK